MKIAEVEYEEFIAWMGYLEEHLDDCRNVLKETIERVPLVQRLMLIYNNAAEDGAEDIMLMRNRDIINVLISLYQLEKGQSAPSVKHSRKRTQHGSEILSLRSGPQRTTTLKRRKPRSSMATPDE